jgi:chitinase
MLIAVLCKGEILDIAEIAATPSLIQLCVKDVEKEGKAEFKVFGKEHTLSMDKPTATKESRPPESSHSSAKTSACSKNANAKRADNNDYCDPQFNKVVTTEIVDDFNVINNPIGEIACNAFGQACMNYRSISRLNADFHTLTCAFRRIPVTARPISRLWAVQHKTAQWDQYITALPQGGCSPDEYPPAVMADVNDGYSLLTSTTQLLPRVPAFRDRGQRIRYLASKSNRDAGVQFNKCGGGPVYTRDHPIESIEQGRRADTTWTKVRAVYTRKRFTVNFAGLETPADDGIPDNPCAPTFQVNGVNAKHPGYALLNTDDWFTANQAEFALVNRYAGAPTKRDWIEGRGLVMIEGNSSRVATPEELRREFGFDSCGDDVCSRELEALKAVIGTVKEAISPTSPVHVGAEATLVSEAINAQDEAVLSAPRYNLIEPHFPVETGRVASMPKLRRTRKI